jgi:hypothetical protein
MILSRHSFFLLLLAVMLLPLPLSKLIWLAGTRETTGTMYFTGHGNLGSVLGISTYPVIWFKHGKDTIFFNGNVNIPLKPEEKISIRYRKKNPEDAKVNTFACIWGDTLAYELGPFLILLIVFFHPDLVPRKSMVMLGKKPFIKFVSTDA